MIDADVTFAPVRDLVAVDLWEGSLPETPEIRAVKVEPARWWLIDAGSLAAEIADAVADRGAVTPIGGGFVRATLSGSGWRDLLSVSGFLDTGAHALPPGAVARTVLHHVAVTVLVTRDTECEVYCAASCARTLQALWHGATGGK